MRTLFLELNFLKIINVNFSLNFILAENFLRVNF
jgi:hypothetical protein